ncbi:MAG: type II toxin-antitoxin system VapC family toxin [Candidatus Promineofilum sp.]|nr:type II toxin-antitoxin system VapC family toxin [Promineifilum sp.]MCW5865149.1 type II toxin-antitoxin system VapC family toxin [Anaerolineae bacterium]
MKYLLDTDICIYLIKRRPESVVRHLAAQQVGDVGVSAVTVAELRYGVARSAQTERNARALELFLAPLVIADFDDGAATAYGAVRAALERAGAPIGALDTLIAAHALSLGATLVTNNTREFDRVPGLSLANWAAG